MPTAKQHCPPTLRCLVCGKDFIPKQWTPSRIGRTKYCSRACRCKALSVSSVAATKGKPGKMWSVETRCKQEKWRGGRVLPPLRTVSSRGYILVRDLSRPSRQVMEHRLIAEKVLGRKLRRNEVVHHIDLNPSNNAHSNLLICTSEYHNWLHWEMQRRWVRDNLLGPT